MRGAWIAWGVAENDQPAIRKARDPPGLQTNTTLPGVAWASQADIMIGAENNLMLTTDTNEEAKMEVEIFKVRERLRPRDFDADNIR